MKEWFTLTEIASFKLPGLPTTRQGLEALVDRDGWRQNRETTRQVKTATKPAWEYHFKLLPPPAQTRLMAIHSSPDAGIEETRKAALWARYEKLPAHQRAECEDRLKTLHLVSDLRASGTSIGAAARIAAKQIGVSPATIFAWQSLCHTVSREDWLAALAPAYAGGRDFVECHKEAWDVLVSDFLRPEKPSFSACFRRMMNAAKQQGWSPIPSERSLRRRLEAEVSSAVQTLARDGRDKAKTLFPAQRRTRDHLTAMQAVNMDGHKLDVFVRMPDGAIVRLFLIALQDLYSGKFVAWRLSDSENKETTRLVIGDMVERFGIPDRITLDNGRAFTSKQITGGIANRYRFKVRDEDPQGLLVTLGVDVQFTKPYSGQSKPIERAWRDLTDDIARHPVCAGAYTGNKPDAKPENYASHAVPLETFRALVDRQMADHNARPGRTGGSCKGRSFDETFEASLAEPSTIVRWASKAQRALWLLASEGISARKGNGEIHLYGNRYWSKELTAFAGQKVIVRYDPDYLTRDLKVYDLANQLICDAPCIADTGFHDAEAARVHEKARGAWQKAVAGEKAAHAALSAQQLAEIYSKGQAEEPATPLSISPRIPRLVTGASAAVRHVADEVSQDDLESSFSRALARVSGEPTIIEFPQGDGPKSSAYGSKKRGGNNPAR